MYQWPFLQLQISFAIIVDVADDLQLDYQSLLKLRCILCIVS